MNDDSRQTPESAPLALVLEHGLSLSTMLVQMGWHVLKVYTVADALGALEERPFGLFFLDLDTPQLEGNRLIRLIRARERALGRRLPILAVTTILREKMAGCLAAGADDCLGRPLDPATFQGFLRRPAWLLHLASLGFDQAAAAQLAQTFLATVPPRLEELRKAFHGNDIPRLHKLTHVLSGSLGVFGADKAVAAAGRLEVNELSLSDFETLEKETVALVDSLRAHLEKSN